jgi:hypothetical protein
MIKKIFGILALLLVIGIIPGVFAEDSNTIDANTLEEVKIFTTPNGAEVRLIQLEKSITRNLLIGAKVIEVISENQLEVDINEAESILNELEALLVEVKDYSIEGKDSNTIVADFVAMKKEAITLTQEFRESTKEVLTSENIQQIHEEIKELDLNELNQINQAVKNAIRKHNSERTQNMLKILGITNPELVQGILDGNLTREQAHTQI